MMSPLTIQALRIVHILVSAMWVGTVLFVASFLLPAAKAIGPAGAAMMQELMIARRLPTYILSSGLLTVLSGLALYWNDSAGFSSPWMSSGPARTFGLGAVFGLVTLVLGVTINAPTAKKLAKLGAAIKGSAAPPTAEQSREMQRLGDRLRGAMNAAAVLLVLAITCMAVARYVPH